MNLISNSFRISSLREDNQNKIGGWDFIHSFVLLWLLLKIVSQCFPEAGMIGYFVFTRLRESGRSFTS